MRITLPWPPSKTSANGSQGDYQGKAKAAKVYKATCAKELWAQKVRPLQGYAKGECVPVTITFHPPSNARMDWDNISNRAKQGWDAVSEAIGIDDGRWWPVTLHRGDKIKGGRIVVELGAQNISTIPIRGTIS